ncbi:glycoside hydrolase family 32 protein [Jiangella anatolica]|uniref:beta-fructofuranosidase n=1 Tax=Jiangella anatolica TaxID=2670374 RepID=A0A2W2C0P4_9ACTN|nr:glycoside hydrolase family 32 protein [Jiangella anatolica]PZF86294.1 glycosyl hydrolase family 32 [Jiangella anatolica]
MTHESTLGPSSALAAHDPQRPRFHFLPPAGWLNDPNGLTQWNGTYHLFYQHNPHAPVHERIHWGHATSADLVTWAHEPTALTPSAGPDEDGCWSGVLVDDGGTPTIVYSGHRGGRELPCVATGSADLRTWRKLPDNPVIAGPPDGLDLTAFRDHCVWREGGRWRQLIGSGIRGVGGAALLYESADLRRWEYVGPLLTGDVTHGSTDDLSWSGSMWECVDLFRLGPDGAAGADVLVASAWHEGATHYPLYWTGDYRGDRFQPVHQGPLDLGGRYFYAPQSFRDEHDRRIMFGWLQEGRDESTVAAAGWSGVMSLPRVVTLGADGRPALAPAAEVTMLRTDPVTVAAGPLGDADPRRLWLGDQFDVEARLVLDPGAAVDLVVRATEDGAERTVVTVSRAADGPGGRIAVDRAAGSLDPSVDATPRGGPVPLGPGGEVDLRVIVDHSAVEIFANGRALTTRVYPTRPDAGGVELRGRAGGSRVERAGAWRMTDIWA